MKKTTTHIRYPFAIDQSLGMLAEEETHAGYVGQLIRQVLFTNPGERVNRPDFGCGLRRMVFAPNSVVTANLTQVTIYQALEKWLSDLIEVEAVKVRAEEEKLIVDISYIIRARAERRYLNIEVDL